MLGKFRTVYHGWLQKPTTKGPLDTLWQSREWINRILNSMDNGDCSIVISYCDVLLERKYFLEFINACNEKRAGIVVFKSDDERFDDVFPGGCHKNSGVFYFQSGQQMMSWLEYLPRDSQNGVPDMVLNSPEPVLFVCNEVIDIGTPEGYKEYING